MSARRVVAALSMGAVAGSLLFAPAASADGLPPLNLSKTTLAVNEPFTVSGTGCVTTEGGSQQGGQVSVYGPSPTAVTVDSAGSWSTTMHFGGLPKDGWLSILAICHYMTPAGPQESAYPSVRVTVVGPPTTVASTSAPRRASVPAPRPSPTSAAPTTTPPPPPVPTGPLPATAAAGCIACARIASGAPLGAGWPVNLRYTGFQPNEQVTLVMHSTPVQLGSFTADPSGVVMASVRIPENAAGGAHTLVFSGPASGERVLPFSVTAAAAGAPAAQPADPAAEGPNLLVRLLAAGAVVALVLLVVGVVIVLRRRRHHDRSAVVAP